MPRQFRMNALVDAEGDNKGHIEISPVTSETEGQVDNMVHLTAHPDGDAQGVFLDVDTLIEALEAVTGRRLKARTLSPVSYTHLTLPTTPYV